MTRNRPDTKPTSLIASPCSNPNRASSTRRAARWAFKIFKARVWARHQAHLKALLDIFFKEKNFMNFWMLKDYRKTCIKMTIIKKLDQKLKKFDIKNLKAWLGLKVLKNLGSSLTIISSIKLWPTVKIQYLKCLNIIILIFYHYLFSNPE